MGGLLGRCLGWPFGFAIVATVAALFIAPGAAWAATRTVTKSADTNDGICDADCSLREAIGVAGAGDVIVFASGLGGTFTLTLGEIAIDQSITVQGPGEAALAVSGNDVSRIFNVGAVNPNAVVTISGLTLQNGRNASAGQATGGAILNNASLTLSRVAIKNSSAIGAATFAARGGALGHVSTAGNLTITTSSFSTNSALGGSSTSAGSAGGNGTGGAIFIATTATGVIDVSRSTFSNNTASSGGNTTAGSAGDAAGGAIAARQTIAISNSTFSANHATAGSNSGGLKGGATGGAVSLDLSGAETATLLNLTLAGNDVDGAAGVTNGGALFFGGGTSTLTNSLLDNNRANGGINMCNTAVTGTNNVQNGAAFCTNPGTTNGNGNLAALGPYGGPTETLKLNAGSAAINAGTNTGCPEVDQRGAPRARTVSDPCDAGAFEIVTAAVVTKTADTKDDTCSVADCSLREALQALDSGGTVTFASGVAGTITLQFGELGVTRSVTVTGPGSGALDISGNNAGRVFAFTNTSGVYSLAGLTLRNGRHAPATGTAQGGAVFNGGHLTLTDVVVKDSVAQAAGSTGAQGGGLAHSSLDPLTIVDSRFSGNSALAGAGVGGNSGGSALGGGLYVSTAGTQQTTLTRVTFSANVATGGDQGTGIGVGSATGGGAYLGQPLVATNVTSSGNSATGGLSSISTRAGASGAGIAVVYSGADAGSITNATIAKNTLVGTTAVGGTTGGGLSFAAIAGGLLSVTNTITSGNVANGVANNCNGPITGSNNIEFGTAAVGCAGAGFTLTDPLLGPLAHYGNAALVHPLLIGSPAINAGTNTGCPTTDQRGFTRITGIPGTCDIGAYEAQNTFAAPRGAPVPPSAAPVAAPPNRR